MPNHRSTRALSASAATTGRFWREAALTTGAIAGVICIVATVAALAFGVTPLIFRSGSMSPDITTGSLALARTVAATELEVGDVVSVENAQGTRITHRVHELVPQSDGMVVATLKGDANRDPDVEPYAIAEADRVFWSVGGLGYVVSWLSSPAAVVLGGVFVGALLVTVFRPGGRRKDDADDEDDEDDSAGPSGGIDETCPVAADAQPISMDSTGVPAPSNTRCGIPPARSMLVVGAAALSVVGLTQAVGTVAAFTDSATARSGALTVSANVLPTVAVTGASDIKFGFGQQDVCRLTWAHLGSPYKYYVTVTNSLGTVRTTEKRADVGANSPVTLDITSELTSWGYNNVAIFTVNEVTGETATSGASFRGAAGHHKR